MRLNANTCDYRIMDLIFLLILCGLWEYASGKGCENKVRQNSFLWKVKRDPPAYFFGTLHVPYTKVWGQIPAASKRAFRGSDNVYFELDLTNKRTRTALTRCQMLPGGADLRQVLPDDLYRRLKRHLDYVKRAMPGWLTSEQAGKGWYADNLFEAIAGNWERKRPVWVMLMVNSLTEDDIRSQGVPVLDLHLASQAGRMGKKVGAIEQVDEQCQPLNGLNMSQVLYALDHTLSMQERVRFGTVSVPYTKEDLIAQYNCGDLDAAIFDSDSSQIPKLVNGSEGAISQEEQNMSDQVDWYFRNELIYRRNKKMAQRVERLLVNNPDQSFFFAFGAGHFLGNGSVIDFLEKAGFEIEHSAEVEPSSPRKRKRAQDRQRKGKSRRRHRSKGRQNNKKSKNKFRNEGSPAPPSVLFPEQEPAFFDSGLPRIRIVNRYPTVAPLLHHNDDWRRAVSRLARLRREKIESESSHGYVWRRANPDSENSWSLRYKKLILNSGAMTQTANGLALTVVALFASLLVSFLNC